MALPRVAMDWNSNSLANQWSQEDLKRQGLELHDGMRCIFYDRDAEDGRSGYLHNDATVWWDVRSNAFRVDMRTVQLRFTPGENPAVLDAEYLE